MHNHAPAAKECKKQAIQCCDLRPTKWPCRIMTMRWEADGRLTSLGLAGL